VRRPAVALAGLALLLVGTGAGGTRAAGPQLKAPGPCPDATGFTCSTLTVPFDRTGKVRGTLDLRVATAPNAAAPRGVLLVLTGGPGQAGEPSVERIATVLAPVLEQYRLVMLDQRGTGAGALDCPALQQEMGASDLALPSPGAVRACAAKLGAARSLYGTDDVVADLEDLRVALGAKTWALDGISYGTFVGERYALAHPDRVAKLVLDSVVPDDAAFGALATDMRAVGRVLRLACRARPCAGDPAADLAAVVRKLHVGPRLLDALVLMSIVDPTQRTRFDVPALLHRARAGSPAGLQALLRTAQAWNAAPATALSQGLHAAAICGDFRFPWGSSAAPLASRARALARAAAAARVWPFDRATATGNGIVRECLPWPPTPPTPSAPARLPAVPILLLAGDRDLSTPLEWARQEAQRAPRGTLVVVPGAGHSVQSRARSALGRNAVFAFLRK
jgi:pimeloyl-ACP methyl ester carboxylesterase